MPSHRDGETELSTYEYRGKIKTRASIFSINSALCLFILNETNLQIPQTTKSSYKHTSSTLRVISFDAERNRKNMKVFMISKSVDH